MDDDELDVEDDMYNTVHDAVRDAMDQRPRKEKHSNAVMEAAITLFFIWFGMEMFDYLSYARWMNKLRYAVWYGVDTSQVEQYTRKPPSDCDFFRAPIGSKGCEYKKHVLEEKATPDNGNKKTITVYWEKVEENK